MIDLKFTLKILLVALVITFIAGYSIFEFRWVILGPIVKINEPKNGASYFENPIKISGQAQNISSLTLNDSPLAIDQNGTFEEKLLLSPGYNIMKLESKDRFGRQKVTYLELLYKL